MNMFLSEAECFASELMNEINNATLHGCDICDGPHATEKCEIFETVCQVTEIDVPPRALLTLPKELKVNYCSTGEKSVIALKSFEKGTIFGPFRAGRIFSPSSTDIFPIRIFDVDSNKDVYLNKDENQSNWMCYILPASNPEEQNLICYQEKSEIYYVARRKIEVGDHLKVWYSDKYIRRLNGRSINFPFIEDPLPITDPVQNQHCITNSFADETIQRQKQYEQLVAGIKEPTRDELIRNELDNLSVDNLPDELLNFCTGLSEVDSIGNLFLENPKVSNTAQEKSIADFSLDLVENVASKPTTESVTNFTSHIQSKYSSNNERPKFKCEDCFKVFVRKENLKNHPCSDKEKKPGPFACNQCARSFKQIKYLNRHMRIHKKNKICQACNTKFNTQEEKIIHVCDKTSATFPCTMCHQHFGKESHLKRHIKNTHEKNNNPPTSQEKGKSFVCEICSKQYTYTNCLNAHMKVHRKAQYKCSLCSKQFGRNDIYIAHVLTHGPPKFECKLCNHKCKTKKLLNVHLFSHNGEKKFSCDICGKQFRQRSNMLKHAKTHSNKEKYCKSCNIDFSTKSEFVKHKNKSHQDIRIYKCSVCDKHYETLELLKRHYRILHSGKSFICKYCNETFFYRNTFKRHLKRKHSNTNEDWDNPNVINNFLVDTNDGVVPELLQIENTVLPAAQTSTSVLLPTSSNDEQALLNFSNNLQDIASTEQDVSGTESSPETMNNVVLLPAEEQLANSEVLLSLPESEQEPLNNSFVLNENFIILHVLEQ